MYGLIIKALHNCQTQQQTTKGVYVCQEALTTILIHTVQCSADCLDLKVSAPAYMTKPRILVGAFP